MVSDTVAPAKSLIPADIIAESKNLIEFCWRVEMISRNRNQRLRMSFCVRRRQGALSLVGLTEKQAPLPSVFTKHLSGDMPSPGRHAPHGASAGDTDVESAPCPHSS